MNTRYEIINAIEREIIGPCPNPAYTDSETGEELLLARIHGSPKTRYGGAMLYPQLTENLGETDDGQSSSGGLQDEAQPDDIQGERVADLAGAESDEEPVSLANQFLPSALGLTIRIKDIDQDDMIEIDVRSACYIKGQDHKNVLKVNAEGGPPVAVQRTNGDLLDSEYWVRRPFKLDTVHFNPAAGKNGKMLLDQVMVRDGESAWLALKIYDRTTEKDKTDGCRTITFVLVNCKTSGTATPLSDRHILYQNKLILKVTNPELILPYSERTAATDTDEENQLRLLYRQKRIFGIGHGTAVNWYGEYKSVTHIETSAMPVFEMPQVAPSGDVELSMYALSDEGNWDAGLGSLDKLKEDYSNWIADMESSISGLDETYRPAATINAAKCRECLSRISEGIAILKNALPDSFTVRSFRWMNRAMIWQQQRSKTKQRLWHRPAGKSLTWTLDHINGGRSADFLSLKEFHEASPFNGRWRPFQLAFILINIRSIISPENPEREIVDLIWFPTGGGKTEAYLGLSAFSIFFRRLQGSSDFDWTNCSGTAILMRYTLRLLTTQQYERASSLICACELIRQKEPELGPDPISIGLWVGGSSTPNSHGTGEGNAVQQYNHLRDVKNAPYNFIIMKCPCCGAQIGKLDTGAATAQIRSKGITRNDGVAGKVVFKCENQHCEFSGRELPLYVVDDYIYEACPTMILGTVDKFAMIPWKENAGKIFGFREQLGQWSRIAPPELIIQDELHLISGPLGTMVGLYEVLVQNLCTDFGRNTAPFLPDDLKALKMPKIIASSATISRAGEQVKSLYGTGLLHIFPPQGLKFGDTWFSEEKPVSEKFPARIYAGILGSGYPSIQSAIIRSYAAGLQKIKELSERPDIDYYWTLLAYFNSIRELGNASSLVHADIRERLNQIQNRELTSYGNRRKLYKAKELTSRISGHEIPEALKDLERSFTAQQNSAIDICLATNMVATGVDISRLGLMFIHGQPKTTAEYIQASSRVGRDVPSGPGLIFTIYSPSKPRDKSLYENFQGYHRRIYSYVEPTSVTPFSINARTKGLHAVFIGIVRHFAESGLRTNAATQYRDFDQLAVIAKRMILNRCAISDPNELSNTETLLDTISNFWKDRFQNYGDAGNFKILSDENYFPLMYATGAEIREDIRGASLPTPTSMRGVDSESHITIVS